MKVLVSFGIVFAAMCAIVSASDYVYRISKKKMSYLKALDFCIQEGGWLAFIDHTEDLVDANRKLKQKKVKTAWIARFNKTRRGGKHQRRHRYLVGANKKKGAFVLEKTKKKAFKMTAHALCQKHGKGESESTSTTTEESYP